MRWARSVTAAMLLTAVVGAAAPDAGRPPDPRTAERLQMVERSIASEGIRDPATLQAMRTVPRHEFVPPSLAEAAYQNRPLPIGLGQTISQPYIVAYQTEVIRPREGLKVLEVGTGSGYQAAVLAATGARVYTMEIFAELASSAEQRLQRLGYRATVRHGDGNLGWPDEAPFDAILVTAAASHVPPALIEQLKPGGRMVIPVGSMYGAQNLLQVDKDASGVVRTRILLPVAFVPMLSGLR
ncbi:MAG: protein-L-isoaspartate(D-aspartate) O-methyltransferase [Myxococcaceae bacterium]